MARAEPDDLGEVVGVARVDRRTKDLAKRIHPGEVAVINHEDLDRSPPRPSSMPVPEP
ncbi:MAG: hypothetical protein WKF43_07150 [Acidimicrobiales bacterium]